MFFLKWTKLMFPGKGEEVGQDLKKKRAQSTCPLLLQMARAPPPAGLGRPWAVCCPLSQLLVCVSFSSQTKDALLKILEDMKEDDYLNFILFSGDVSTWKESLVQATPENIQEARKFVKSITDQGSKDRGESRCSHCCLCTWAACAPPPCGPGPADPG